MNKALLFATGILFLFLITSCARDEILQIADSQKNISQAEISSAGIKEGDLVEMNFILYGEDGRIIDTNNKQKAEQAGLKTYTAGIYKFIVGQSGKVNGFDKAVLGLEIGDKKTLDIPASKEKLELEFQREHIESRIKTIPLAQTFPLTGFEKTFNKPPIIGDVVVNREKFPWPYKIIAITNNSALGEIVIKQGEKVQLPGTQWQSQATAVSERVIQFLQLPANGQEIKTEFGTAVIDVARSRMKIMHNPEKGKEFFYTLPSEQLISPRYEFRITEVNEDTFKIIRINFPEQENLKLEVEILDVMPGKTIRKAKLAF